MNALAVALDKWWNDSEALATNEDRFTINDDTLVSDYVKPIEYDNSCTADVTTVNEKSADIFWRGTSDVRSWKPELQARDTTVTPAGHKLYQSFDKFGNRIIRWFDTTDSNVTFRIRVVADTFVVEMFRNYRVNGKWRGSNSQTTYVAPNCYGDDAEQRVTYWIMSKLSRSL